MTRYDPCVVQTFADKLYLQARTLSATATVLAALVGGAAGTVHSGTLAVVGAIVGALAGFAWSRSKTFALRLQAQQALCQMQIEANTRKAA